MSGGRGRQRNFIPLVPASISRAHSINTIDANVRWGDGNRNQPKTIAKGDVDLQADLNEINAGRAVLMENGDILVSSGRIYGIHSGKNSVFLRSGSPGTIDLTQAEFRILRAMFEEGGLQGNALKRLEGLLRVGNRGISERSRATLIELFNSRR